MFGLVCMTFGETQTLTRYQPESHRPSSHHRIAENKFSTPYITYSEWQKSSTGYNLLRIAKKNSSLYLTYSANIYMFKVNNRNTRKRFEIYWNLSIKTPEQPHWPIRTYFIPFSSASVVYFEQVNVCWALGIVQISKTFHSV